jgi:hypothetical protein
MAIGSDVPAGFLGNNYAVFPWIGCDKAECSYCGEGWPNLCVPITTSPAPACAVRLARHCNETCTGLAQIVGQL